MSLINQIERKLARSLPSNFAKDFYPRAMRRLAEHGILRGLHEVDVRHGFRMYVDRLDAVKWYIYYFGEFEPQISLAWKNLLNPGDSVLDIGANVGYHSLLAASLVGKSGAVYSFEPGRRIFPQLLQHRELNNFDNIVPIQKAVSDRSEVARFYYGGDNVQGNSSLIGREDQEFDMVECISFLDLGKDVPLDSIKLVKIDVEGAEERIISGMGDALHLFPNDVMLFVEISPENAVRADQILSPLVKAGFKMRLIENDYTTAFYRQKSTIKLMPPAFASGVIHDVVLCRDEEKFQTLVHGRKSGGQA